ncbi:hypothetical protein V6N13_059600 [Hibiscus sabdariffa]
MRDSCPEKTPAAERSASPPANTAQPPGSDTDAFGPWMVVERRQRRPAQFVDAQESARNVDPDHDGISRVHVDAHQRKGKAIATARKQRAIHVRKPLTVNLNDFPIMTKSATKASSSRLPQLQNNTSKLDKARHSSIVISENLDPNMQSPSMIPHETLACNNSLGTRKPPDPHLLLHPNHGVNNIRENPTTLVLSADSRLVVQDSAMVLFGDFNAILYRSDRKGGSSSMKPTVQHLLRLKLDHRPILLQVGTSVSRSSHAPFRYLSGWSSHIDFDRMVADNWSPSSSLSETITSFTKVADVWNKTIYGYIGSKKRVVMARLRGVQKALCAKSSRFFINLESELIMELENILDHEELLWRQKSVACVMY